MRIVGTTLRTPPGGTVTSADAELIRDVLLAHAGGVGDIEHITVTVLPLGLGIAVLLNDRAADPEGRVMRLLKIASGRSALLDQWLAAMECESEANQS
jgi:hypothetical protein